MKDAPKSGPRAVPPSARAGSVVEALRELRAEVVTHTADVLNRLDRAIEEAESIALFVAAAEGGSDVPDASERARLRAFRGNGDLVIDVAEKHGVSLREIVGPGAPPTPAGAAARDAAVVALAEAGLSAADIARVLNVSFEAARRRVAARKAAA